MTAKSSGSSARSPLDHQREALWIIRPARSRRDVVLESLIQHYRYLAIVVGTFAEGETVLLLGSFAAYRGYRRGDGGVGAV